VFPRVQHEAVLLDFRTVFPEEEEAVVEIVGRVLTVPAE